MRHLVITLLIALSGNAWAGGVPGPQPGAPTVKSATQTISFNSATNTAIFSWSKLAEDVVEGELREVNLQKTSSTGEMTTTVIADTSVSGTRTFSNLSPGYYRFCHITRDPEYPTRDGTSACYSSGLMGFVWANLTTTAVFIPDNTVIPEITDLEASSIRRDFNGVFKASFYEHFASTALIGIGGGLERRFTLENLTTGGTQAGIDIGGTATMTVTSSGEYRITVKACPIQINGECSLTRISSPFIVELTPSAATLTTPLITAQRATLEIIGTTFTSNSINPRYIISSRSKGTDDVWSTWKNEKTISIASADKSKSQNHIVNIDNLVNDKFYEFRVQSCNSSCSEFISPQLVETDFPYAQQMKVSTNVSHNGYIGIEWNATNLSYNPVYVLRETEQSTGAVVDTDYIPTSTVIADNFTKIRNGLYSYQVNGCYEYLGERSCTGFTSALNVNVDIQLATPTLTAPTSTSSFNIPLSWNAVSGVSGNDVYYQIYSTSNALLHTTSVGTTSWSYTAPVNGSYGFQIRACVPAACSARSATKTVLVTVAPAQPSLTVANVTNSHNFTLSWPAAANADSYTLEHKYGLGSWGALTNNSTARSYTVAIPSASTPHGTHYYRVKACENALNSCSAYSNIITKNVDTRPTVGNLTIDRNASQCDAMTSDKCYSRIPNISFAWDQDTSGLVQYYQITEASSVMPLLTVNVSGSNHINTGNIDGLNTGTYHFKYRACSNYGIESCSDYSSTEEVQISIPTPVTQQPILSVKENGIATGIVTGPYSVEWNEVDRAVIYKVYQKQHSSEAFTLVATLGASDAENGVISFNYSPQAPNLMAWGEHSYYVTAYNSDNNSTSPAPVSSTVVITVEQDETVELRKQLYYSEANDLIDNLDLPNYGQYDRDNAAFRYLDLMYSFNSDADIVVSDFFSGDGSLQTPRDFSELYDNAERARIDSVLLQLQENLSNAYNLVDQNDPETTTRFTRSKELLLDVFYDRAVAEIVLGNQDMDNARINRLREEGFNNEVNDLEAAYDHYYKALSDYANLFTQVEYDYTNLLNEQFENRKQQSPRYWQANGGAVNVILEGSAEESQLLDSYKDLAMYFDLMSKVINSKVEQTKLEVTASTVNQNQLDQMKLDLLDLKAELGNWTSTLQSKFPNTVFSSITTLDVLQAMDRYNQALANINNAINWINGDTNILGLTDDSLIIVNGFGVDGNQTFNSFDAITGILVGSGSKKGALTLAKEEFAEAISSYENYRHNQDRLATEYSDRNVQLSNLLVGLIGWEVPLGCHKDCVIQSEDSIKGSQIAIQVKRIEQADLDMETAVQRLENLELNIQDLVDAEQIRTGIENLMNETILDYGHEQATINQKIAKIQERVAKARKRSGLFKSAVNFGAAIVTGNYAAAAMTLVDTAGDLHVANAEIRATKDIGVLQALSTELAAAERVQINEFYTQIRQTEFDTMIRSRLRDVALLELEIEKAALSAEQEQDRLIGLVTQAARVMTQIEQTNLNLADRYFADPIHASRLTKAMEKAERSFQDAQQWMFYAAQALEYKWLVDFNFNGYFTEDILRARTVTELEDVLYSGMQPLDTNKNAANAIQSAQHTLSFKEDVFGYYDRVNDETQYYPHPAGDTTTDNEGNTIPVTLRADDAFKEALLLRKETLSNGDYIKINFDTFKPDASGTFFTGPLFNSENCIVEGGTYLDKIESVGINVSNYFFGGENKTEAYLSYGGTSYVRNKEPGIATSTSDGFDIDEFTSFPVLFWDDEDDDFDRSQSIKFFASLTGTVDTSSTTQAFKERSVAASDWYLRLQLNSDTKTFIEVNSIDDIELIFDHRYLNRNYNGNCQ